MQVGSYWVNTVLEEYDTENKTFLAFKDSPGNPLSHSLKEETVGLLIKKKY